MPFVVRDEDGKIAAVHDRASAEASEELGADDPELLDHLAELEREGRLKESLVITDAEMARVTEDLIETLIEKNVIMLTDLPRPAQEKILERRRMREHMSEMIGLISDDDVL